MNKHPYSYLELLISKKMNAESAVKFLNGGKQVVFPLVGGGESEPYNSKEAAWKALVRFTTQKEIGIENFGPYRDQILNQDNLLWSEAEVKLAESAAWNESNPG